MAERKYFFQKGNKYGSKGRPKGGTAAWCKEFALGEGQEILKYWARQKKNGKVAIQAVTLIYAYGLGKPTENHNIEGTVSLIDMVAGANEDDE